MISSVTQFMCTRDRLALLDTTDCIQAFNFFSFDTLLSCSIVFTSIYSDKYDELHSLPKSLYSYE